MDFSINGAGSMDMHLENKINLDLYHTQKSVAKRKILVADSLWYNAPKREKWSNKPARGKQKEDKSLWPSTRERFLKADTKISMNKGKNW